MKYRLYTIFKKAFPILIPAVFGAVGGYLFYRFVGCASGTCPITSSPFLSTIYGGVIGGLSGSAFTSGTCPFCADGKCEVNEGE